MAGARGPARRQLVARVLGPRNRRRPPARVRVAPTARQLARLAAGVACAGVVLAAGPAVVRRFQHHPYFAVREVVVHGTRRLPPDAVRRIAGVEPGISVWDVDHRVAEGRLLEDPWVRWANVRRQLPHRVVIRVREERPAAILAMDGTAKEPSLWYVAAPARVVAPVGEGDQRDFPYLTGLTREDVDGGAAFGPQAIRQALRLVRAAARRGPVSEVHVDRRRGLTLLPVEPAVPVEIGWGRYAEKLARLPPVLAQWTGRETDLAGISVLFRDEVIVRTRALKPAKPAART